MEERKSPLKNIGCAVLGIYFVSVMLFAPYYNWKFAQRAGFVPWLFGGDIMGTFKGVLWPYFLWSDHSEGVRRQQATAYFAALNQVGSGHEPINGMLNDAIIRANERSKILGDAEGQKQFAEDCDKIIKLYHADLDEASVIVPPPFLVEFHEKIVEENRQGRELMDKFYAAIVAEGDGARTASLQKDIHDLRKRIEEQVAMQLQELGLDQ